MKNLVLAMLFLGAAYSATIQVPEDYATIQAAINASKDGDTIQVAPDTYNENIDFNGKNITVEGENQETTIIDGGHNGSVVTLEGGEIAILSGFTIRNGEAVSGGGIYISESNPTLTNLTISGNTAIDGAGIFINYDSNPILTNLTISKNTAEYLGGGIYIKESDPTLTNLTISGNTAEYYGGGIYIDDSNLILTNLTISGNTAGNYGGGIYINYDSSITFSSSIIWGNAVSNGFSDNCFGEEDSQLIFLYSDVQDPDSIDSTVSWGAGNIVSDPLFVDADSGDFSLQEGSPCIGAGLGGVDMGANQDGFNNDDCSFEDANVDGYDDASYSAGAASGDVSGDSIINVIDIVALVNIIINQ